MMSAIRSVGPGGQADSSDAHEGRYYATSRRDPSSDNPASAFVRVHPRPILPRGDLLLLLALTLLALILRLSHLQDQSLWVDEANTYYQNYGPLGEMLARARLIAIDFPLDRFFLNAVSVFPPNEFSQRLPAALFGVLAVPLTYAFARRLWGRHAGLLAAGLLAFSPYAIRYSQEARNYSSFTALHLLSLICLLGALRRPTRGRWLAYALTSALALLDHVYAVVALGLQFGFLALILMVDALRRYPPRELRRRWPALLRPAGEHLLALAVAGLLFLPWALLVLTADRTGASVAQGFGAWRTLSSVQFTPDVLLRMLRWLSANANATTPLFVLIVGMGLLAGVLPRPTAETQRAQRPNRDAERTPSETLGDLSASAANSFGDAPLGRPWLAWLGWAYIVLALVGVAIGARLGNNYVGYRRLLFILPVLLTLAGAGLDALLRLTVDRLACLRRRAPALGLIVALIAGVAALSWPAILSHYQAQKENWRGLTQVLRREAGPDDLIVNYIVSRETSRALQAYLGADLAGLRLLPAADVLQEGTLPASGVVWEIFPFPLDGDSPDRWALNDLERLRVLDGDASLDPLQMMLSLQRTRPADVATLRRQVIAGLEQTARTQVLIFSSWRFSAFDALAGEYERQGQLSETMALYRAMAEHPSVSADVRANMAATLAYLDQKLSRDVDVILGGYWADPTLRAALVAGLQGRGALPAGAADAAQLRAATEALAAGARPAGNLARAGDFAGDWPAAWKARLRNAQIEQTAAGCPAGAPACLHISTTGRGYQGDLRQTIKVEPGALYALRCTLKAQSDLGLQGKALYVEYAQGGKTRGVYASAFWGSDAGQTFVALFVPPAGVGQIVFAPLLLDNAGQVWLTDVQVARLP